MNHHYSTLKCTLKNPTSNSVALKMNPEMDMSEMRVPLQGVVKIFKAGLKSKTWDIHGMPQFNMTTHREGCECFGTQAKTVVFKAKTLQP